MDNFVRPMVLVGPLSYHPLILEIQDLACKYIEYSRFGNLRLMACQKYWIFKIWNFKISALLIIEIFLKFGNSRFDLPSIENFRFVNWRLMACQILKTFKIWKFKIWPAKYWKFKILKPKFWKFKMLSTCHLYFLKCSLLAKINALFTCSQMLTKIIQCP